jgi:glucose/arabinose dehydrogenase
MRRIRLLALAAVMSISALALTACPIPNGYQATPVFPHVNFGLMLGLYPIPSEGSQAVAVSKDGYARRVDLANPGAPATVFLDVSGKLINPIAGEEGLLGFAFAPDYATSGTFYVYYTAGEPRRSVISRFHAAPGGAADPGSEQIILQVPQPYANHNGGHIVFGPDGNLYIGLGDGGSAGDPQGNGQDLNTLLGKLLRIDVAQPQYRIPPDNPFIGHGRGEIYAYGLRNPWRFSFDALTGQLWIADVGQNAWEEVNKGFAGANYGWNITEGYHCFRDDACNTAGITLPRAVYSHDDGCSVTGGYVYRGTEMPEMVGWYVYGDFCSGKLWAINAEADAGDPVPLADTGLRITSFAEINGELYLVTFNNAIYKLTRK